MQQNAKWTQQQDDRLLAAVKKHGTQWGLVIKEINHSRSLNAIIKRWHGYLRRNLSNEFLSPHKSPPPEKKKQQVQKTNKNDKKRKASPESQNDQMKDQNEQKIFTQTQNTQAVKKIMEQPYEYKLNWCEEDDIRLKNLILSDGILFWDKIAASFHTTNQQVMTRWIKIICPKLKNNVKIGGALKWSVNQDYILYAADRSKVSHLDLMFFLPYRTVYSIEARWRRICKSSELIDHMTILNNRNNIRREALKKIALKRCIQKRDIMTKICQKQREIHERQKLEQEKSQLIRRQDKMRKIQKF